MSESFQSVQMLVSFIFQCICFAGMLFQLTQVFEMYLRYKVESKLEISIPEVIKAHTLTICSFLGLLADGKSLERISYENKTAADVLKNTRSRELFSILAVVKVKGNWIRKRGEMPPDMYFKRSKFMFSSQVCYQYEPRNFSLVEIDAVSGNGMTVGTIYDIYIEPELYVFKPILHSERFPFSAISASQFVSHGTKGYKAEEAKAKKTGNETEKYVINNWTKTHPQNVVTERLKEPYETRCFDYQKIGLESRKECLHKCKLDQSIAWLNKLPPDVIISEKYELQFITGRERDELDAYKKILKVCATFCDRPACHETITITKMSQLAFSQFIVTHEIPFSPWFKIQYRSIMSLIDLITYTMSTIGMYTGFSFMTVNPETVFKKTRKNVQKIRKHKDKARIHLESWREKLRKKLIERRATDLPNDNRISIPVAPTHYSNVKQGKELSFWQMMQ